MPIFLEAHHVDTRTGFTCSECGFDSVEEFTVALADASTLAYVARYTFRRCCRCDDED